MGENQLKRRGNRPSGLQRLWRTPQRVFEYREKISDYWSHLRDLEFSVKGLKVKAHFYILLENIYLEGKTRMKMEVSS